MFGIIKALEKISRGAVLWIYLKASARPRKRL
jgi:hypothetical protein